MAFTITRKLKTNKVYPQIPATIEQEEELVPVEYTAEYVEKTWTDPDSGDEKASVRFLIKISGAAYVSRMSFQFSYTESVKILEEAEAALQTALGSQ
ncbi:TPA: hypothetical protein R4126_003691 [Klebsiella michiganensis]|nr:hypothetical protein [Klebsiella michiganensis]